MTMLKRDNQSGRFCAGRQVAYRRQLSDRAVVHALAEHTCRSITRKTIAFLQGMRQDTMPSGDDSGLENTWDEICVQVQGEQSVLWELYEDTVRGILEGLVEELLPHEREAIWLETDQASDWGYEEDDERDPEPVFNDDIVAYLLRDHIYGEAGNWSNRRIRAYLEIVWASD